MQWPDQRKAPHPKKAFAARKFLSVNYSSNVPDLCTRQTYFHSPGVVTFAKVTFFANNYKRVGWVEEGMG